LEGLQKKERVPKVAKQNSTKGVGGGNFRAKKKRRFPGGGGVKNSKRSKPKFTCFKTGRKHENINFYEKIEPPTSQNHPEAAERKSVQT